MTDQSPLLQVKDLTIAFPSRKGDHTAVEGLSFAIQSGETLGFVGASGSGKTATALALLGLLPPRAQVTGTILWKGQRLIRQSDWLPVRGSGITMMFQDARASLNPARTVGRQMLSICERFETQPGPIPQEQILALLEKVRIQDVRRISAAYPHELSGGEAQRVALALALACKPELLIVDEPTAALDPPVALAIVALLRSIRANEGISFLVISHDLNVIRATCDDICVIHAGRIVDRGRTGEILSSPQVEETVAFVRAAEWELPPIALLPTPVLPEN